MENMKTIKFGENGEVYAVNAPAVSVVGELTENAAVLDFGTFEDGLTELECMVSGVDGTEGTYVHLVVNGVQSAFLTTGQFYKARAYVRLKKLGENWALFVHAFPNNADVTNAYSVMNGVDKITSFAIKAYGATSFAAGTKYSLEGR